MTESFSIQRITRESPQVDTLAGWEFGEWGHHHPGRTLAQATALFRAACGEGGVPSVFAAIVDGAAVGMASLLAQDMDTRPELTPWLASVFVLPAWRGRGIASQLVRRVEGEARDNGIDCFYLFTPDQQSLYRRLGWRDREVCEYHGESVTIMCRRLAEGVTPGRSGPRS
ncbi:MAG: GNAT family N-acetyltransferase [Haliea sp.]|nr:GNAT family N-acetyltransferase [Haliea sp.]